MIPDVMSRIQHELFVWLAILLMKKMIYGELWESKTDFSPVSKRLAKESLMLRSSFPILFGLFC